MKLGAASANTAWLLASIAESFRFHRTASDVEHAQRALLQRYLERNAATQFGKSHGFDRLRHWEEFADRVPTRTYDQFDPWIARIAAGQQRVLTVDPVKLLEPTSGSSGAEKWIPYTGTLQDEIRRAVATWISDIFLADRHLMGGRAYWSLTPRTDSGRKVQSKVPVGFDEDSAYLGGFAQRLVRQTLATSPDLRNERDMDRFWNATLLQLLDCRDLRLISVWHPSFPLILLGHLRQKWTALLAELDQRKRPRAAELAAIDPARPCDIWPELRLISCWGDGHAAGYMNGLMARFPGVSIQPKGLVATEALVTIPVGQQKPLAIRSHFFEFRRRDGSIVPAWALEEGDTCEVIVTTGGGLYRYELRDIVRVSGFYRDIPSLTFVGKADNVVDLCGEKLSESFVASCLDRVFAHADLAPRFAMLAPVASNGNPGYGLYIETAGDLPAGLASGLEDELLANPHYRLCIELGQLGPLQICEIRAGATQAYLQRMMHGGMRLGDIKPTCLSRLSGWSDVFDIVS